MEITLEKIELVKDRTGVSYKEARDALEAANGNVVDAIISIEESIDFNGKGKVSQQTNQIVGRIKEAVKKGNVTKITIKKNNEIILNLPVNIGLISAVVFPWFTLASTIAALGTRCQIELVKDNGDIVDISEFAMGTIDEVKEKGTEFAGDVKEKSSEVYESVKTKASDAIHKATKKAEDVVDDIEEIFNDDDEPKKEKE